MPEKIGELYAKLTLQADQFRNELNKIAGETKSFSEKIQDIGKVATVAGAAITGAFTKMTYDAIRYTTEIDKMAKATGVSVETLQELRYAVEQEHGSFEALASSLRILAMRIQQTDIESQKARKILEELGIAIYDNTGKMRNMVDILLDVGEVLRSIPDETKRTAIATELFGRQVFNILPFLLSGRQKINELRKEARELGIVMSQETVRAGKELSDQFQKLKAATLGFSLAIAQHTIPIISRFIGLLTNLVEVFHRLPAPIRATVSVGGLLGGVFLTVGGAITLLLPKLFNVGLVLKGLATSILPALLSPVGALTTALIGLAGAFGYLTFKMLDFEVQSKKIIESSRRLTEENFRANIPYMDRANKLKFLEDRLKTLQEIERKYYEKSLKMQGEQRKETERFLEKTRYEIEKTQRQINEIKFYELNREIKKVTENTDNLTKALKNIPLTADFVGKSIAEVMEGIEKEVIERSMEKIREQFAEGWDRLVEETEKDLARARSVSEKFGDALNNVFWSVIEGSEDLSVAIEKMVISIIKDITAAIIKLLIFKAVAAALGVSTGGVGFATFFLGWETPLLDMRTMLLGFKEASYQLNEIGKKWTRDAVRYYEMGRSMAIPRAETTTPPIVLVHIEAAPGAFVKAIRQLSPNELNQIEEEILSKTRVYRGKL